jgi:hypothetical protein
VRHIWYGDEEIEPHPPSRKSPLSQDVSSSDYSTSTSEDDEVVENVTVVSTKKLLIGRIADVV